MTVKNISPILTRYGISEPGKIFHIEKIRRKGEIVICPKCGKQRYMAPHFAKRRKSDYCIHCIPSKNKKSHSKIILLLQNPKTQSLACVAGIVGLSRERVRQIAKEENITRFTIAERRFRWNCYQCNSPMERNLFQIKNFKNPALCGNCAQGKGRFCRKGHENPPRNKQGRCRICDREYRNRIVDYRTCQDCGKVIPVTYASRAQAKTHSFTLKRCQQCHGKWVVKTNHIKQKDKPFCKHGHPRTPENLNCYRQCKMCQKLRRRKNYVPTTASQVSVS